MFFCGGGGGGGFGVVLGFFFVSFLSYFGFSGLVYFLALLDSCYFQYGHA